MTERLHFKNIIAHYRWVHFCSQAWPNERQRMWWPSVGQRGINVRVF